MSDTPEIQIEEETFIPHENLLYDVIMRQAGTLQKAILEGVMNAVDAGAKKCEVSLGTRHFSLLDDGHGFQSRFEIKEYFKKFGTPHKEGDARYGRYRMGRGQMMAFGKTAWRSRLFGMNVDVKARGLKFDVITYPEDFPGTRIEGELYDPIAPSEVERIKSELRQFVAWGEIPVYLDGEQISTRPDAGKWTHQDEDAYYALSSDRSRLSVYNLGVLVKSFSAQEYGIGGTVVSKRQLDVNFARNDILSSCPVMKKISASLRKQAGTEVKKKTKLTDSERAMLAREFLSGEIDVENIERIRVISDVHGRRWQLNKLAAIKQEFSGKLVVADRGDLMLETAQNRGVAFTVDQATLERFGVTTGEALINRIITAARNLSNSQDRYRNWHLRHLADALEEVQVVDREALTALVSSDHIGLEKSELTWDFKVILAAIERGYNHLVMMLNRSYFGDRSFTCRTIKLGKSETALAWTDGTNTIWIDIDHARELRKGYAGAYLLAQTLLHETLHEGPDTGTHQHDYEFYKDYHDMSGLSTDPLGAGARKMVKYFISQLRAHKKKVSSTLLQHEDKELEIDVLREEISNPQG